MPEFILDHGTREAGKRFQALDSFTQGYIQAMFFTNTGDPDDSERGMQHATLAELSEQGWKKIEANCAAFQEANKADLEEACDVTGYDEERAGNDYWYTSQGHGVGYWDRDLGDVGERLSVASGWYQLDFYRGDDGLLYLD